LIPTSAFIRVSCWFSGGSAPESQTLLPLRSISNSMARKHIITILLIEPEMPEGVSARKLVVETAKHNVISAYGGVEGLKMFARFPKVDAVVIHSDLKDMACDDVAQQIRAKDKKIPIAALSPNAQGCKAPAVNRTLSSHEPKALLDYLANDLGAETSN
jgi:CheY-like chemotaxis protein